MMVAPYLKDRSTGQGHQPLQLMRKPRDALQSGQAPVIISMRFSRWSEGLIDGRRIATRHDTCSNGHALQSQASPLLS